MSDNTFEQQQQQQQEQQQYSEDEPSDILHEIEEIVEHHVPLWIVAIGGIIVAILVLVPNFCVGKRNVKSD
jgi:hypothetical protein